MHWGGLENEHNMTEMFFPHTKVACDSKARNRAVLFVKEKKSPASGCAIRHLGLVEVGVLSVCHFH